MTSDVGVAARFAAGDSDAVREIYQAYGRLVYTVAYKVLGDVSLAEDATQQTFVQAWRAAASYDPSREIAPWLATIARRVAISAYRSHRRHDDLATADPGDRNLISLPPSVEQIYDVWEVRRALQTLTAADRELIQLTHYGELTHSEIAERLSIPIGTVKSRSHRAHRRLAALLGHLRAGPEDGPEDPDLRPARGGAP